MLAGQGQRRWRRWAVRLGWAVAIAAGLAYLPYEVSGGSATRRLSAMRQDLERTRGVIREVEEKNAELRSDISALKEDPRAVEDIARDDLGMVFPGEVVIRMERDPR